LVQIKNGSPLSVSPGWDWTTMSGLYQSVGKYSQQPRALEDYIRQNPDLADARFHLAYHYLTAGHRDEAAKQLKDISGSLRTIRSPGSCWR
jgi:hypothetical protein